MAQARDLLKALYKCFDETDASLVEVNPLIIAGDGNVIAFGSTRDLVPAVGNPFPAANHAYSASCCPLNSAFTWLPVRIRPGHTVVTVTPYSNEEELIAMANETNYGLSATLWTQNLNRAHRLAERIDVGTVWINCWLLRDLRVPFGGTKQSGVGREGGDEALRFFTEPKTVCVKT